MAKSPIKNGENDDLDRAMRQSEEEGRGRETENGLEGTTPQPDPNNKISKGDGDSDL